MALLRRVHRRNFLAGAVAAPFFIPQFAQGIHSQSVAVVGDAGVISNSISQIRASVLRCGVRDLVLLGDNLYFAERDSYESIWQPWRNEGLNFAVTALGNHNAGYDREMAFFQMPQENYQRKIGPFEFIVLNSDNRDSVNNQIGFLESAFAQSRSPFKFLVVHHPFVTVSDRHKWTERYDFQKLFRQFVEAQQNEIVAILSGHDHVASLTKVNDLPLIVCGASWEFFAPKFLNYQDGPFHILSEWRYQGHPHWVRLECFEDLGEVWAHFVDAKMDRTVHSTKLWPRSFS